jgi:hypothetical protein
MNGRVRARARLFLRGRTRPSYIERKIDGNESPKTLRAEDVGMSTRATKTFGLIPLIVLTFGACGDDPVSPKEITRADITRSFAATTFTATSGGATVDLLSIGATLDITLREDGTTTGRLFAPGADEDGNDLDLSLDGTFEFVDSTDRVTFAHPADTFVRDVTFTASWAGGVVQLAAEDTFGGTTVRVVLR